MPKIFFAADHSGFEEKEALIAYVRDELHYEVEDCGAYTYDSQDDYPDFSVACAKNVLATPGSFGIIGGGSGNGEAIAANRMPGIRAAVFYGRVEPVSSIDSMGTRGAGDGFDIVRLARKHNDANILSLGYRFMTLQDMQVAIRIFLETSFEGGRHEARVKKLG